MKLTATMASGLRSLAKSRRMASGGPQARYTTIVETMVLKALAEGPTALQPSPAVVHLRFAKTRGQGC